MLLFEWYFWQTIKAKPNLLKWLVHILVRGCLLGFLSTVDQKNQKPNNICRMETVQILNLVFAALESFV